MIEVLKIIINGQCQDMGIQQLVLEVMPDHLHLFVGAKPTVTPFKIMHKLKGNISIQINGSQEQIGKDVSEISLNRLFADVLLN